MTPNQHPSAYHHYGGISPEGCTEPAAMLMVPRAVVEGLLEVEPVEWLRKRWHCLYCEASAPERPAHPDCVDHTDTCPWAMLRAQVRA